MKNNKNTNSIDDLKREQSKRAIIRDKEYLRPLLSLFKDEGASLKDVKSKVSEEIVNSKTISISSSTKVTAHFSVSALIKYFNRNTTYYYQNANNVIDAWFSDYNSEIKQNLLKPDILILDCYGVRDYKGPLERVLYEILDIRLTSGKRTWIFFNERNLNGFENIRSNIQAQITIFENGGKTNE